jgi:hypothetical protein
MICKNYAPIYEQQMSKNENLNRSAGLTNNVPPLVENVMYFPTFAPSIFNMGKCVLNQLLKIENSYKTYCCKQPTIFNNYYHGRLEISTQLWYRRSH